MPTYVPCGDKQYYVDPVGSYGYTNIDSACAYTGTRKTCQSTAMTCPTTTMVIAPTDANGSPLPPGTIVDVLHPVTGATVPAVVSADGSTAIIPPTTATTTDAPVGAVPGSVVATSVGPAVVTNTGIAVSTSTVSSNGWVDALLGLGIFFAVLSVLNMLGMFPLLYGIVRREIRKADGTLMKVLKSIGNVLFAVLLMPWFTWLNMRQY